MSKDIARYRLSELPDRNYPPYRIQAGGDVPTAANADWEHFLRTWTEFQSHSAAVAIRFVYDPQQNRSGPKQRLSVWLMGQAHSAGARRILSLLLERSPVRRFYDLQPADGAGITWGKFSAACDVVRRQSILEPTVTAEFNAKALPAYYTISSFEPNEDNDYLLLDSLLSRLQEPALVEICIEPADIRRQLSAHTRYAPPSVREKRLCPDCGRPLERESGCFVCQACGYSKCG